MKDDIHNYESCINRIDALERELNYYKKYSQVNFLYGQYGTYEAINHLKEKKIISDINKKKRKIQVLYHVYIIDQVSFPLIEELTSDNLIEVRLLASNKNNYKTLKKMGHQCYLPYHKSFQNDKNSIRNSNFYPDVVFSEMPYGIFPSQEQSVRQWMIEGNWLPNYKDIFGMEIINHALFCYIPYGFTIAAKWGWLKSEHGFSCHYELPYHNYCWKYFLESNDHLEYALKENQRGNISNYIVTGYSKYDVYGKIDSNYSNKSNKTVFYAPHSFRSNKNFQDTLQILHELAKTKKFLIYVKPHPNKNSEMEKLLKKYSKEPNFVVIRDGDKTQELIKIADLLIVSSVSMHADALFSQKPFLTELEEAHFNVVGKEIHRTASNSKNCSINITDIKKALKKDPSINKRAKLIEKLNPKKYKSSKFIVEHIKKCLII